MDISTLVNITSKAWSLTIMSLMHAGVPGRRARLLSASGAGRTAFTQSLEHLIELEMMERNPGHGHPLRPEFRLTPKGAVIAAAAARIMAITVPEGLPLIRKTWTVPVLTALHQPLRFNEIKSELPSITDRALSQSLKSMEALDWVHRDVDTLARPPRSLYQAVNTGGQISEALHTVLPLA